MFFYCLICNMLLEVVLPFQNLYNGAVPGTKTRVGNGN
jgi:hypothetical protein